jgi:hypothetical protein
VLAKDTLVRIRLLETLGTRRNERGDEFHAEVVNDVEVDNQTAIPSGSKVFGVVTHCKRAGRIKGRAEMNLRFDEVELPNRVKIPIQATVDSIEERADEEVKDDEGTIQAPGEMKKSAKRVGVTSGIGALIGVLTGGGRGAKAGAATGAVAGVAGVLFTRGSDILLYSQTEMTIRLSTETEIQPGILRRAP